MYQCSRFLYVILWLRCLRNQPSLMYHNHKIEILKMYFSISQYLWKILIFSRTFSMMIRFQTESKIYRFVKDTLSFTDTNPIWLSTVRNATIQNLDLMTAIRIWIWIFPEFTMNEVILIYLLAKISSLLKPGSSNIGRHLKAIVINTMFNRLASKTKTDRSLNQYNRKMKAFAMAIIPASLSLVWLEFHFFVL